MSGPLEPPELTASQTAMLHSWLGPWSLLSDMSWPTQDTRVLVIDRAGERLVVKASVPNVSPGSTSHHIAREIGAHHILGNRLGDRAPQLLHASIEESILVRKHLPGSMVEGSDDEWNPDLYRQAADLLLLLRRPVRMSTDYLDQLAVRSRSALAAARPLMPAEHAAEIQKRITNTVSRPVELSFTHGDFQPRNWLADGGQLRLIDFGRGQWRHWTSDLVRMRHQQFLSHPDLKVAFEERLGMLDATDQEVLALEEVGQAVGTIAWAHAVGDHRFEEQGREMVSRIIEGTPSN